MQSGDTTGDTPVEGERGVEGRQGQEEREEKPKKKEKKVLLYQPFIVVI